MEPLRETDDASRPTGSNRPTSRAVEDDPKRSTLEFLAEIEDQAPISVEIVLDAETQAALEPRGHSLPPVSILPGENAIATRRRRAAVRIQSARDAFRLISHLDVDEEQRRILARTLMQLGEGAPAHVDASGLVSDPESALRDATTAWLGELEGRLSALEDALLQVDDSLGRDAFRERIECARHSGKLLARYGRLLASRRFPAGGRRDRFEWLATRLLTAPLEGGGRAPLAAERARPVLQQLVGGLLFKARPDELAEALRYLREAHSRLDQFQDADAFFDSGEFLDVHGFKVSMRDQLGNPDFLYLSVAWNAKLECLIERWIRDAERRHPPNHLPPGGPPRARILGKLREQERTVDEIFGVRAPRPRTRTQASLPPPGATTRRTAPPARSKSRRAVLLALLALLAVTAGGAAVYGLLPL